MRSGALLAAVIAGVFLLLWVFAGDIASWCYANNAAWLAPLFELSLLIDATALMVLFTLILAVLPNPEQE